MLFLEVRWRLISSVLHQRSSWPLTSIKTRPLFSQCLNFLFDRLCAALCLFSWSERMCIPRRWWVLVCACRRNTLLFNKALASFIWGSTLSFFLLLFFPSAFPEAHLETFEFEKAKCLISLTSLLAGTLTKNEMVFKRLHLGTVSYGTDTMDEIQSHIIQSYAQVRPLKSFISGNKKNI